MSNTLITNMGNPVSHDVNVGYEENFESHAPCSRSVVMERLSKTLLQMASCTPDREDAYSATVREALMELVDDDQILFCWV